MFAKATQDRTDFDFSQSNDHNLITLPGTSIPRVTSLETSLRDITMELSDPEPNKRRDVKNLIVGGSRVQYTDRFGTTLASMLGQSRSVYNLFEPAEVIERALYRGAKDKIRVSVMETKQGESIALAAVRPKAHVVPVEKYAELLADQGVDLMNVGFHNGIITTTHNPSLPMGFEVGGDEMTSKFVLQMPVDGYGSASSFLALIRAICANLGIMMTPAFRTDISLGDGKNDALPTIGRFFGAFNNEEGFNAAAERLKSAATTRASLDEYHKIQKQLHKIGAGGHADGVGAAAWNKLDMADGSPLSAYETTRALAELAGPIGEKFGFATLDQVAAKTRRQLPTDMSVYDLFNFTTEVATHYANEGARRTLNAALGTMLTEPFDLEMEEAQKASETIVTRPPQAFYLQGFLDEREQREQLRAAHGLN